jgi:hypothetical protein
VPYPIKIGWLGAALDGSGGGCDRTAVAGADRSDHAIAVGPLADFEGRFEQWE